MIWLWVEFLACAAVIVAAGYFLVRFGDVIAERTGLGRLWAGVILIATATSLPELFTGVSSVLIFDVPDIAVGSLLGSCVFNLLLLVILDFASKKRSFFDGVNPAYIVETSFSLVMVAIVALGLFLCNALECFPWVWPGSLLIPIIYVFAVRVTVREGRYPPYTQEMVAREEPKPKKRSKQRSVSLGKAILGYSISAAFVIGAAIWLPGVSDKIAESTGLGSSFVGGILVALTTSLPEIVTTLTAFRIGAAEMAFSNIIGSNMFNMLILGIDDMLYVRGPIFSAVSGVHLATAIIVMGMTGVVITALAVRKQRKFLRLSWASWVLVAGFLLNTLILALLG
ncbi:MAG: sodium:calcium antiporter [Candidatus Stahlbacteria bacterium]|nr:MAG: sodium:calcium antiporter [Candidatus Stahlbacteria bacterium]